MIAMLTWHAAEEIEHKSVAFDVYQAFHGGYWLRAWGLVCALVQTIRDLRTFTKHMLTVDGLWDDRASRRRLSKVRIALLRRLIPPLRTYLRPSYHRAFETCEPSRSTASAAGSRMGATARRIGIDAAARSRVSDDDARLTQ